MVPKNCVSKDLKLSEVGRFICQPRVTVVNQWASGGTAQKLHTVGLVPRSDCANDALFMTSTVGLLAIAKFHLQSTAFVRYTDCAKLYNRSSKRISLSDLTSVSSFLNFNQPISFDTVGLRRQQEIVYCMYSMVLLV